MPCLTGPDKSEDNRHYWKLQRVLQNITDEGEYVSSSLHGRQWLFRGSSYKEAEALLMIEFQSKNRFHYQEDPKFFVRFGICRESREEIAVSEFTIEKYYNSTKIHIPIKRSEIQFIMQKNKVLYFFIEVVTNADKETQDTKTRKRKIERNFEETLLSGKNSDLTIDVKRKKFKCHRVILETRSPVFSAMLEHDMKEKASGIVTIKDAEPSAFQEFLLYLYTGNQYHLNWENVVELYKLGDKYAVEDLKTLCVEHMKEYISIENHLQYFRLSQQYNETELGKNAVELFKNNTDEILESEKWIEFLKNNPDECNLFLKAALRKK